MTEKFYTDEAAFDAALQAAGAQASTFDFTGERSADYSTASGYTKNGVTFVGDKQNGYSLSVASAGFYAKDYPVTSIQGPAASSNYYNIQNGSTAISLPNGSYALGLRLFTVHTGDTAGGFTDTASLTAVDSQGNAATGTGTTASGSSYGSGGGFLGVISSAPLTGATLKGSASEDFVDVAQVTTAGGPSPGGSVPAISGTHGSATSNEAALSPFSGATISDPGTGASDTVTIQLSGGGGTLSGAGLSGGSGGTYALAAAGPSTLTSEIDALSFTPAAAAPGSQSTTTLAVTVKNGSGSVTDSNTTVTDSAAASPAPGGAATSGSDALQIISATVDRRGNLVITGNAVGNQGTASVTLSGSVDGAPAALLPASVTYSGATDQNGTFTATYALGQDTLGFVSATLDDRAGGSTSVGLPESFSGSTGAVVARGDTYSADGSAVVSSTTYKRNGHQSVDITGSGLTLTSNSFDTFDDHGNPDNTFVFRQGHGLDVIDLFRVGGADHDTLSFTGADFGNDVANVLQNTQDAKGGAVILDPTTGDTVKLVGVSKARLGQNAADIAFHA